MVQWHGVQALVKNFRLQLLLRPIEDAGDLLRKTIREALLEVCQEDFASDLHVFNLLLCVDVPSTV